MAEILDVIQRFTYQVEDAELQRAAQSLQQQVAAIGTMAQRVQNLQNAFDRTSASEIDKRTRISGLIQRQKALIDQTTQSMGKQVQENSKLQQALTKEIGLLNTLDAKLKLLREDRAKAFDPKEIASFNKQIEATTAQINKLTGASGKGGVLSTILQGVGIGTGIGVVTQGAQLLKDFVGDSIRASAEAQGVERAFNRLNDPRLLQNLRDSVRGTVSDLELMKQAVQFNNFGLPVEKMGIALAFARQRAQDTGQSIDYLVQSIVTGIGRQSPLILDNLGINAKRVADRFKETGNFAEAAFGIIQEEAAKAGNSLDTFADKQARVNAQWENMKRRIGDVITTIIVDLADAGDSLLDWWIGEDQLKAADEFFKAQREAQIAAQEERLSIQEKYARQYEKADLLEKRIILNNARKHYNDLIREQQRFYNAGLGSAGDALQGDISSLQSFLNNPPSSATTAPKTPQGKAAARAKREVKSNAIAPKDLLDLPQSEQDKVLNELDAFITRVESKIAERKTQMAKNQDALGQTGTSTYRPTGSNQGDITYTEDELISSRNDAERVNKKREEDDKKAKDARELRVQQEKDAFKTIADAAIQSYSIILQAQINAADAEIAIRQQRVNAAIELAKDGNEEVLKLEQERLEDSIKERQKFANRQAAINAALTISQSVLAIATAAGETGAGAIAVVPAVIAAIAAGFAAVTTLSENSTPGFKDGVVDLQGEGTGKSDSIPARLSRGESVITAEATQKNKAVLMAMNNGAVFTMPNTYTSTTNYSNNADMSGVVSELKSLKTVIADTKLKQDIFFNEYGVGVLTSRAIKRNKKMNS